MPDARIYKDANNIVFQTYSGIFVSYDGCSIVNIRVPPEYW